MFRNAGKLEETAQGDKLMSKRMLLSGSNGSTFPATYITFVGYQRKCTQR